MGAVQGTAKGQGYAPNLQDMDKPHEGVRRRRWCCLGAGGDHRGRWTRLTDGWWGCVRQLCETQGNPMLRCASS